MNNRLRTVLVLSLAVACALAVAASASGRTTHSHLRVEAAGQALEPGTNYSNQSIDTRNSRACGSINSRRERLRGPSAMGLVGHAAEVNARLRPFRTSDTFDFGAIVCEINRFTGFGDRYWLYNVNHELATIGGDQLRVGRGDDVLWYYVRCTRTNANFECVDGENYGEELDLSAPVRTRPGAFSIRAFEYSDTGQRIPQGGIRVSGPGVTPVTTGPDGRATLSATSSTTLRATRPSQGDIPSQPLEVCVNSNLSRCPDGRGETFVGTGGADEVRATGGPDVIRPRGGRDLIEANTGDDRINARGGGLDRVDCGPGRDAVKADLDDRAGGSCEQVSRRR
jgi:hypothetical protein